MNLDSVSLKEFAIEEFFTHKNAGRLNNITLQDLRQKDTICLYGYFSKLITGNCNSDSFEALHLIKESNRILITNTIEDPGKGVDISYLDPFIQHYGEILIVNENGNHRIVDTTCRTIYFLTPLECFTRVPPNEIGKNNLKFLSELFY